MGWNQTGTVTAQFVVIEGPTGGLFLYQISGGFTVSFVSSTTWTAPGAVSSANVQCWGGGGGGGALDGGAGGGGEYAQEATNTVVAGDVYTVTVGAAGSSSDGSGDSTNGGNTSFSGTAATTVTAHGGKLGTDGDGSTTPGTGGTGGTGSTNSVHHNGGAGGTPSAIFEGGGGGGGSGGTSAAGNAGTSPTGSNGNAGAAAVSGGGPGGDGGDGAPGSAPVSLPGGGGGGGGSANNGGEGSRGRVSITYGVNSPTLVASFCGSATTDPLTGISCPQDLTFFASPTTSVTLAASTAGLLSINNGVVISAGGLSVTDGTMTDSLTVTGTITSVSGTQAAPTLITTDSWNAPSPNAGWALGSNDGTAQNLAYRLTPDGLVQLLGSIHSTSASPNANFFTLPTGYRPGTNQRFSVVEVASGNAFANEVGVATTGITGALLVTTASGTDYHFDNFYRLS